MPKEENSKNIVEEDFEDCQFILSMTHSTKRIEFVSKKPLKEYQCTSR